MYLRDAGPICYEVDLFVAPTAQRLAPILLVPELAWAWRSEWTWPRERGVTRRSRLKPVESASIHDLAGDAAFRDADGYGRSITMIALQPDWWDGDEGALDGPIRDFARGAKGPIQAIVIQVGDAQHEHAFVPQTPSQPVRAFLASVGPPPDAYLARAYRRLGTAALEVQLSLDAGR
jgi:hypothetical protein